MQCWAKKIRASSRRLLRFRGSWRLTSFRRYLSPALSFVFTEERESLRLGRAGLNRREMLTCTAVAIPAVAAAFAADTDVNGRPWRVIDTNISLFRWPFRRLPLDTTSEMVKQLRLLQIDQAWAGSYEGLLHRDITAVNQRLADECNSVAGNLLLPIGAINLTMPDWEEDLYRCHEVHRMPGIRVYPNYHGYALDNARFKRLIELAAKRGMFVQLAVTLEDIRTQHPLARVDDVDLTPLPDLMREIPNARVQLLNYRPSGAIFERLAKTAGIYFDVSRVEATDGVRKLIRIVPSGRVVFGTHAPFLIYQAALIRAYESDLSDVESRALFETNAVNLLMKPTNR